MVEMPTTVPQSGDRPLETHRRRAASMTIAIDGRRVDWVVAETQLRRTRRTMTVTVYSTER